MSTALDLNKDTCNYTATVFHCDHYNIDIRPDVCIDRQKNAKIISKSKQPRQIHPFLHCMSCRQGLDVINKKVETFQRIYENIPVVSMKKSDLNKFFVVSGSEYEEKEHRALVNNYQTLKFKDGMLGEKKKKEKKPVNDIKPVEKTEPDEPVVIETQKPVEEICVETETETGAEALIEVKAEAEETAVVYNYEDTRLDENNIFNRLNIEEIHPGGHIEFKGSDPGERLYMCEICMRNDIRREDMIQCQRSKRFPLGVKNTCIKCSSTKENKKNQADIQHVEKKFFKESSQPKKAETVSIDFSSNVKMLRQIEKEAVKEYRTVNQQILYMLSKNISFV